MFIAAPLGVDKAWALNYDFLAFYEKDIFTTKTQGLKERNLNQRFLLCVLVTLWHSIPR